MCCAVLCSVVSYDTNISINIQHFNRQSVVVVNLGSGWLFIIFWNRKYHLSSFEKYQHETGLAKKVDPTYQQRGLTYQQRVLAYQQRSSTTLTITITNSIFRHMKFTTVFYYEFFNNTFIVKEITLIHKMSLACNYLLLLIVLSSTKYDITWCHLFNYKELTYSRFS